MSLVPALDLRSDAAKAAADAPPANIEIEQALLGIVLYDNDAYHRFEGVRAAHFYEPFHARLWQAISADIEKGLKADPITLMDRFVADPAFDELGGIRYLADLVDRCPSVTAAPTYAAGIIDLAMRRDVQRICAEGREAAKDFDLPSREVVAGVEQELYALAETTSRSGFRPFSEVLVGAMEMAAEAFNRDGSLAGMATGLTDVDKMTGGLHDSDLIIVGARPGMGKSAWGLNVAFHAAKTYRYEPQPDGSRKTVSGGRVGVFSLEMSAEQLAFRLVAQASGVAGDKLRKGEVEYTEFGRVRDAANLISEIPLYIDDTGGLTIGKLAARARRLKRTHGLDLVVVDYIQLLAGSKQYTGGQRTQEVTEITVGLKALAKELKCPIIALAQLSRKVEDRDDKKPQLSDLRESGSIEQDADMVIFLYREEYYLGRAEPKAGTTEHVAWQDAMDACRDQAEAIIAKQRHGPIGTVRLNFNGKLTMFSDRPRESTFTGNASLPYRDDA